MEKLGELQMKMDFLWENIKRFNNRIILHGGGRYIYCWSSFIWSALRFGCSPDDYFRYEFYKKSNFERNKFITYRRSKKLIQKYNDANFVNILHDKRQFNQFFYKFIKRAWIDPDNSTIEQFGTFIKEYNNVIIKPITGGQGLGIHKYIYSESDHIEDIYNSFKGCLIEEVILQHYDLNEINPSSVNTVRVLTFLNENEVHIIACSLRIGSGNSCVDNLHAGGISASVDIKSGLVYVPGINNNFTRSFFHPYSNKLLIGFQIPNWNKVIDTVKEAALMIPQIRYIGWDVAIMHDDVAIIEANHDPGHDIVQMIDQIGKYEIIKNYLS